ncbi:T9SS type A sorting domain-containing protein [candidate division KSB1 bacterium]|nr:T9SS type A sorting domain-containing protein [candidate division KSB1 bacterium]
MLKICRYFLIRLILFSIIYTTWAGANAASSEKSITFLNSLIGDNFPICTKLNDQQNPAMAYNTKSNEFLIVWHDNINDMNERDIYGQRVSNTGMLIGSDFPICTAQNDQDFPAVAYNKKDNEYLIIWRDNRKFDQQHPHDKQIYGQRVSSDGRLISSNFPVSTMPTDLVRNPAIAYGDRPNEYLAVWEVDVDTTGPASGWSFKIRGQRISATGQLLDNPGTLADESDPKINFPISAEESVELQGCTPDIVYNYRDAQYLVVWRDGRYYFGSGNDDIFGQIITQQGEHFLPHDIEICLQHDRNGKGGQRQNGATATYNDQNNEYLVVWHDERNDLDRNAEPIECDIYGQIISNDGRLVDNTTTQLDESDPTINYLICNAESIQSWPKVAFDKNRSTYLVVWTDWRNDPGDKSNSDIYGQFLSRQCDLIDEFTTPEDESNPKVNYIFSNAENNQGTWKDSWWAEEYGGISIDYSTNDSQFLLVWADQRNKNTNGVDIYGQLAMSPITPVTIEPHVLDKVFPCQEFWVDIKLGSNAPVDDLKIVSFEMNYTNPALIDYVNYKIGECMEGGEVIVDETNGKISASVYKTSGGFSGQCVVLRLKFKVVDLISKSDTVCFSFGNVQAHNVNGDEIILSPQTNCTEIVAVIVWPGDANNDGAVSIFDINSIVAIYWEKTGPERPNASIQWSDQPCAPWTPLAATYADCNGGGNVDIFDINPVIINFGKKHTLLNTFMSIEEDELNKSLAESPIYFDTRGCDTADSMWVDINVGSESQPVQDLKVVSFELTYSHTENIDFISYEIGNFPSAAEAIVVADDSLGKMSASVYRRNGGESGSGTALRLKFWCKAKGTLVNFHFDGVEANKANGYPIALAPRDTSVICSVDKISGQSLPKEFSLLDNYPNPFNPITTIPFQLPKSSNIQISIFNLKGQFVTTLFKGIKEAGFHSLVWDAAQSNAGTYFIHMVADDFVETRKCTLLK